MIILHFPLQVFKTFLKCLLKVQVSPVWAKFATNCPVNGLTLPKPVTRSFRICLQAISGCLPLSDHVAERVAVLLKENSSWNKTTVFSFSAQ